jgi:eukaryotic-like serine/threonine-protein kinase
MQTSVPIRVQIVPSEKSPGFSQLPIQNQHTTNDLAGQESGMPSKEINTQEVSKDFILMGRYRLLDELGRGGCGAVYRAWDIRLNKAVAIKENLDNRPEAQRQFSREASILAHLSHSNLVRVTDHFAIPGEGQYLVMDFVEGEDIESLIKRKGRLPIEITLSYGYQVLDALDYLHSLNPQIIHRDIKPANIRITPDNHVVLVDFGLVKIYNPEVPTTYGARGVSPGFAPPEQYGTGKTDQRSDIYSFCATMYHMMTGKKPVESVLRSPENQLTPAHVLNSEIPIQISMAIQNGMAMEPDQRFQSVKELRTALQITPPASNQPIHFSQLDDASMRNSLPSLRDPVQNPIASAGKKGKKKALPRAIFIVFGISLFIIVLVFLMGVGYFQMQLSAQATYRANIRDTAIKAVNATHTAQTSQQFPVLP